MDRRLTCLCQDDWDGRKEALQLPQAAVVLFLSGSVGGTVRM